MITTLILLTAMNATETTVPRPAEVTLPETVIVASAARSASNERIWVCSANWQPSAVGGAFRKCEYVTKGKEPKGF